MPKRKFECGDWLANARAALSESIGHNDQYGGQYTRIRGDLYLMSIGVFTNVGGWKQRWGLKASD